MRNPQFPDLVVRFFARWICHSPADESAGMSYEKKMPAPIKAPVRATPVKVELLESFDPEPETQTVTDTVLVFTAPPGGAISVDGYYGASQPLANFMPTSVLTTKGDILGDNGTAPTRIPVGTNGQVLTANSAQPLGVQWETPAGFTPVGATSVQYAQVGTGPGTVAAGQPITYGSTPVPGPAGAFTLTTAIQGPFSASGSVVTVANAGSYLVSFQQTAQADGSVGIYYGTTLGGMAVLPYTLVGGATATSQTSGSFIVPCAAGSFLAICAAAGNAAPLDPYANASTTNASSTSLALVRIA